MKRSNMCPNIGTVLVLVSALWLTPTRAETLGDVLEADEAITNLARCAPLVRLCNNIFDREFMASTGLSDEQQFALGGTCANVDRAYSNAKEHDPGAGQRIADMSRRRAAMAGVQTAEQKAQNAAECFAAFGR